MFLCCVETSFWKMMSGAGVRFEDDIGFLRVRFVSLVGSQCSVREAF